MCFSLKCCDFSELCKLCCKRWGLTCHCVHTHTPTSRGKLREARVRNIFLNLGKHTIFSEHPVHRGTCNDYVGKEWCYEFWQKFCRPRCFNRRTQGWTDKVLIRRSCLASRNEYAYTGWKAKILPRIFIFSLAKSSSTRLLLV